MTAENMIARSTSSDILPIRYMAVSFVRFYFEALFDT